MPKYFSTSNRALPQCAKATAPWWGVALLDQDVTVETAHLVDCEDADAAEGTGGNGQDFAFSDVGTQVALRVALQTVEGDVAGSDVAFQSAAGDVRSAAVLQQTVLDQLVLNSAAGAHLAGRSIAAVEAHEGVVQGVVEL